jgi:Glycosyl hydrolases family 43
MWIRLPTMDRDEDSTKMNIFTAKNRTFVLRAFFALVVCIPTLLLMVPTGGRAFGATWGTAINQDFPDPAILYFNGTYYAYSTQVLTDNVPYSTSTDGVHWSPASGDAMPTLASWASFGDTWAPTVAEDGARQFVMFYTAKDSASGKQCIGEAEASSPAGPFVDGSAGPVICDPSAGGDIDPDIFVDQTTGHSYLIWKVNSNVIGQATSLWAVQMSPDFQLSGSPRALLADDQPWQAGDIEGPNMIEQDGTYYLFYGANEYFSAQYAIGYATCASPLGPCSDSRDNPVLVSSAGMSGPGGPSFFNGPEGLEMAFSAWPGAVGYVSGGYRAMYTATVTFEDGVPRFNPVVPDANSSSYWTFAANGSVDTFKSLYHGSHPAVALAPIVGAAAAPDGEGYWIVTSDGAVYAFGDARNFGGMSGRTLAQPIVGMAVTPDGAGYWLVAADGGVFSFGDAQFEGSMGGKPLNRPIVGIASDPATGGYWLTASDGGVFSFNAQFSGSTGNIRLNKPVVGIAATPDGGGYWLVAADGGVFSFGDAAFHGSTGAIRLNRPVVGMATPPDGRGYWLVAADGGIFAFGGAGFSGSTGGERLKAPMVAVEADSA